MTNNLCKEGGAAASAGDGAYEVQQVEITAVLPHVISTIQGQIRPECKMKWTSLLNRGLCPFSGY